MADKRPQSSDLHPYARGLLTHACALLEDQGVFWRPQPDDWLSASDALARRSWFEVDNALLSLVKDGVAAGSLPRFSMAPLKSGRLDELAGKGAVFRRELNQVQRVRHDLAMVNAECECGGWGTADDIRACVTRHKLLDAWSRQDWPMPQAAQQSPAQTEADEVITTHSPEAIPAPSSCASPPPGPADASRGRTAGELAQYFTDKMGRQVPDPTSRRYRDLLIEKGIIEMQPNGSISALDIQKLEKMPPEFWLMVLPTRGRPRAGESEQTLPPIIAPRRRD